MMTKRILVCLAALLLLGATKPEIRSSLLTVEGEVLAIGHEAGEGGVDLLMVTLAGNEQKPPISLLLAPAEVLDALGFEIAVGDRLEAKVFPDFEGPAKVHKVKNLSHGTMLRLRTLHRIPLWNSAGIWQGGPGRGTMGCPESRSTRRQGGERGG